MTPVEARREMETWKPKDNQEETCGGQEGDGNMEAQRQPGRDLWRPGGRWKHGSPKTTRRSPVEAELKEINLSWAPHRDWLETGRGGGILSLPSLNARGQNRLITYMRTLSGILTAINWVTINATSLLSDKNLHG